jgi:adenylate kinase family enzyme
MSSFLLVAPPIKVSAQSEHNRTEPVLDHYRRTFVRVFVVDGEGSVEEVFARMAGPLARIQSSSSR